jgi:hypothetical protein
MSSDGRHIILDGKSKSPIRFQYHCIYNNLSNYIIMISISGLCVSVPPLRERPKQTRNPVQYYHTLFFINTIIIGWWIGQKKTKNRLIAVVVRNMLIISTRPV